MLAFWIVASPRTESHLPGAISERSAWIGPFEDYPSARSAWQDYDGRRCGGAPLRYRIERLDPEEPPPCTD